MADRKYTETSTLLSCAKIQDPTEQMSPDWAVTLIARRHKTELQLAKASWHVADCVVVLLQGIGGDFFFAGSRIFPGYIC